MPDGVEVITPVPSATKDIRPETIIDPDNHFLRLFTGGSTGKPKVWSKSPRNLLTEAFYIRETFSLSDKDIFVATVPPYHIYGLLFSILVPFVSHARILPDIYTFRRKSFPPSTKQSVCFSQCTHPLPCPESGGPVCSLAAIRLFFSRRS